MLEARIALKAAEENYASRFGWLRFGGLGSGVRWLKNMDGSSELRQASESSAVLTLTILRGTPGIDNRFTVGVVFGRIFTNTSVATPGTPFVMATGS
jgi:hypothetical protein